MIRGASFCKEVRKRVSLTRGSVCARVVYLQLLPRLAPLRAAARYGDKRRVLPGQPVARSTRVRFRLIPPLMGSSRQALEARCYTRGLIDKALL